MRKLFAVLVIAGVAGFIGYTIGVSQLRIRFANYKPAVVTSKIPPSSVTADFSLFWTIWDKVSREYVDKTAINQKNMVQGAISGMVASLGDPYTVYLPPVQNKAAKEDLGGYFDGVGIELGYKDKQLAVVAPLEGTPAFKAGVKSGDLILHIKDVAKKIDADTTNMTIPEAVNIIRGPRGSEIELTFYRTGLSKPLVLKMARDTILVKSATVEFLNNNTVARLKLNKFGDRTPAEWNEAVNQIISLPVGQLKGIVLDLRNNPGGYLDGAVYIAGEFLPKGKLVVTQQYGDGSQNDLKVNRAGKLLKQKVVVLVNEGSASAAEILAGALQDYQRAVAVGVKSFGKGSVQQPDDFADGSGIHVTIAKWLRPNGDWIDKKGILPDVEVKLGENATNSATDAQLQKAIELL